MSPKQKVNIACGITCFLFAAFYFYLALNLSVAAMLEVTQISAKFVPILLAVVIAGLSVLLVAATFWEPAAAKAESSEEVEFADKPAFYGTTAVGFLSLLVWYLVGFFSVPFAIGGIMFVNHSRKPLRIMCVSAAATVILYVVFFKIFNAPLPLGLLE